MVAAIETASCRGVSGLQILISETEIRGGVADLARQVAADYRDRQLTVLGVLTGSIMLLADLIRQVNLPLRVGLIQASSYRGQTTTPGDLTINHSFLTDVADRDVLLLDDIFDTGHTLAALLETLKKMKPRSIRSAVLLWKEGRQQVQVTPDYHCFKIPNAFVVGYGLDYNGEYRHLPYVATLTETDL